MECVPEHWHTIGTDAKGVTRVQTDTQFTGQWKQQLQLLKGRFIMVKLNDAVGKLTEFHDYLLRRGGRVAEGAPLLMECIDKTHLLHTYAQQHPYYIRTKDTFRRALNRVNVSQHFRRESQVTDWHFTDDVYSTLLEVFDARTSRVDGDLPDELQELRESLVDMQQAYRDALSQK